MGGIATRTIVAALAGLWLASACRQLNESHCGNQGGGAACLLRDDKTPFCNLCEVENDGCVASPMFASECGGSSTSITPEPTTSSTTAPADSTTAAESTTTSTGAVDSTSTGEPNLCMNGVIDEGEECDGDVLPEGVDCQFKEDFGKGLPECSEDCSTIDYTVCPLYGLCGNGEAGFGEECDGNFFANGVMSCDDLPNLTGDGLVCTQDCMLDVSGCTMCEEHDQPCDPKSDVCCDEGDVCQATLSGVRCCAMGTGDCIL